MELTTEQFNALRLVVKAEPSLQAALTNGADYLVADWCNAPTTYVVWRTNVSERELMLGFDWTRVDNLSVGKARIWEWMFRFDNINPSKVNIRAGIDAAWVGTTADLAVRAAVYSYCKRFATNAEKVLATTPGNGLDATPATMTFEGKISVETAGLFKF